jgi:hypothetical protein
MSSTVYRLGMSTPFTYEFRLDPAETVRAIHDVQRRQRFAFLHSSRWDWAIWAVFGAMAVLYFFLPVDLRPLWLVGIIAFFLAGLMSFVPWIVRGQLRRAYKETPSLQGLQVYQFSDDGLTIKGNATTLTLGWDSFVEAAETPAFFLFYYSKRHAHYFPKRVISDERELRRLREVIRAKLGERAAGLGAL